MQKLFEILCLEFPLTCGSFWGPHSVECMDDMWVKGDCILEGEDYPSVSNNTADDLKYLNLL